MKEKEKGKLWVVVTPPGGGVVTVTRGGVVTVPGGGGAVTVPGGGGAVTVPGRGGAEAVLAEQFSEKLAARLRPAGGEGPTRPLHVIVNCSARGELVAAALKEVQRGGTFCEAGPSGWDLGRVHKQRQDLFHLMWDPHAPPDPRQVSATAGGDEGVRNLTKPY
eukprot:368237-Prorocentrum_minimum.AAC.1